MEDEVNIKKTNEIQARNKAQEIIDAIQRDECDELVSNDIIEANKYLLEEGEKPYFFDIFKDKILSELKTTINSCVKVRNNPKKKDDLKKYKEGYFNEIIQNANDVIWKTDKKNPIVDVIVLRQGMTYTVTCNYPDNGFSLENIYGFCTRGNSDKKSENGQEGMYGIGIKSLFCFVDEFEIKSNIYIKISSTNGKKLNNISLEVNNIKNNQTSLSFRFVYDEKKENKHAGFNVSKLAKFIDEIYKENKDKSYNQFLFDGKDNEIVFDARSLFFTELRGNREEENSIKNIKFFKSRDEEITGLKLDKGEEILNLKAIEETIKKDDNIKIKKVKIQNYNDNYLLFHYKSKQISIAFRYNQNELYDEKLEDRLYSTYFIGTYESKQPFLWIKTGCLINTVAINSSRSGLERENEKEPDVLEDIKLIGKNIVETLCDLAQKDKDFLDVLCQLLWLYRNCSIEGENGLYPKYIFEDKLEYIESSIIKWSFFNKKYILKEEDGICNQSKTVEKNKPLNSSRDNIEKLYITYRKYFVSIEDDSDIILYNSNDFNVLPIGVRNLCESIFRNENGLWIREIKHIPFLSSIKSVLIKRIGGYEFENIQTFLNNIYDDNEKKLVKQLIARYEVNKCFDYRGDYSDDNVRNWLFLSDDNIQDKEYKYIINEYKQHYGSLKKLIQDYICDARYYYSTNWNASSDWWYDNYKKLSFKNNSTICENDIILLLKLIRKKIVKIGKSQFSYNDLFVHNCGENIVLRNRNRGTTYWNGKFKYFNLDLLDRVMCTFNSFKIARKYIDEYNETVKDVFKINYIKSCKIAKSNISNLNDIFKWFAEYKNIDDLCINVININEIEFENQNQSNSDLFNFIKKFIGDNIFIKIDIISLKNNKKRFIGFISNIDEGRNGIYIKRSSQEVFRRIGSNRFDNNKKYLIIYSNFDDEQYILSTVLDELKYGSDICSYVENFIKTGNIRTLSSQVYDRFLKRKRLKYEYPFEYEELETFNAVNNSNSLSIEDIYDILSSEMSYDNHCPLCNQFPTLNIKEKDSNIKASEKRNSTIAMFIAKYKDRYIYIKILCCKDCFEEYKNSLTEATVEDIENVSYKKLILKNTISTSTRTHDLINEIIISPDNWVIISNFNNL